ncbi:N,N-dimethylformamidase beta subunit family domain-containing protein [Sphingomonas sp. 28-63-12]|uniref:N,N-dimethylformamidase beta subunit family domain-containing protein n=1 Tax=Sphingomonas sp. 28-63-12 TaxID=1970434 RepID=UPI000BD1D0DD|nr:MAG: hypothetical protein B7Y47_11235 [Sphingomonas sp. 28-63-12]
MTATIDPPTQGQFLPREQGFDVTNRDFYEVPIDDSSLAQGWCYTDQLSYRPGDVIAVHAAGNTGWIDLAVIRDGIRPLVVHELKGVAVIWASLPADFHATGCGWPVAVRWTLPDDIASGFYIVRLSGVDANGVECHHEHGFVVRSGEGARAPILLLAATATWIAYNDWGGTNAYYAPTRPDGLAFGARLTIHRPFARGFVSLPVGAPRKPHAAVPPLGGIPRYPPIEFAYARGYSKWYANAGWASYERHFGCWAEREGYAVDYATQHDLDADPALLDGYACVVVVGHDEYWSAPMRDALDIYVERGGRFARFGGNIAWQIRLEDDGTTQICYKTSAATHDPVAGTAAAATLTTVWDAPELGRPAAASFGVTSSYGIYAGVGGQVARGPAGFTVYRPDHWAFAGTELGYGDVLGGAARIFGYEVDGLDYMVRDGIPHPTGRDGAPDGVQIIAMSLAANREVVPVRPGAISYYGDTAPFLAQLRDASADPDRIASAARGSGMIVHFERGAGEVFCAGSSEWVAGLEAGDRQTEAVTRNVLDRFIAK